MRNGLILALSYLMLTSPLPAAEKQWVQAEQHADQSRQAIRFCQRYASGWLSFADSESGLLPRYLTRPDQNYWNAQDCAADNYPFIVLTAFISDNHFLKQASRHILEQEQKLTNRVGVLPDDFHFATQGFPDREPPVAHLLFGASEYAKDGLLPITEWMGPSEWSQRMVELIDAIWAQVPADDPAALPTDNLEVHGELLQVMSRLYWMTGEPRYREWSFRIADYYLLNDLLLKRNTLRLRDHGCEIIGGLSEVYVIAWQEDPDRHRRYKPALHAVLDLVLRVGVNDDGMMVDVISPKDEKIVDDRISDGWGYVYNAFLTVDMIDQVPAYREAIVHALGRVHKYMGHRWEGDSADGYADTLEGAINLLNRIPDESAWAWVNQEINFIFNKQQPNGVIDSNYADGNAARTMLMYALYKTQGVTLSPWRDDLRLGAVTDSDGSLRLFLHGDYPWQGRIRFDRPRSRDVWHLPFDYPRINQFPEWFTIRADQDYELTTADERTAQKVRGEQLYDLNWQLEADRPLRMIIRPVEPAEPQTQPATGDSRPAETTLPVDAGHGATPAAATSGEMSAEAAGDIETEKIETEKIETEKMVEAEVTVEREIPAGTEKNEVGSPEKSLTRAPADPASSQRIMRYTSRSAGNAIVWQQVLRAELAERLGLWGRQDREFPLSPRLLSVGPHDSYSRREVEFNLDPQQRIKAIVTVPIAEKTDLEKPYPVVIAIAGKDQNRESVYLPESPSRGFAEALASDGYITLAVDPGPRWQGAGSQITLADELWTLMRCVDLLEILPEVDVARIGCAGVGQGGELAMWLAAMDERIAGVVTADFLPDIQQTDRSDAGAYGAVRELVDIGDIYGLIAPRPLQCQFGLKNNINPARIEAAQRTMLDIKRIYDDFEKAGHAGLAIHPHGAQMDLPSLEIFFATHLAGRTEP